MSFLASTGNAIGMGVGGVAAVIVLCAVFYVVGRGEDRDRAAAPQNAAPAVPPESNGAEADEERQDPRRVRPSSSRRRRGP